MVSQLLVSPPSSKVSHHRGDGTRTNVRDELHALREATGAGAAGKIDATNGVALTPIKSPDATEADELVTKGQVDDKLAERVVLMDFLTSGQRSSLRAGNYPGDLAAAFRAMRSALLAHQGAAASWAGFLVEAAPYRFPTSFNMWFAGVRRWKLLGYGARFKPISASPWDLHKNGFVANPHPTCLTGNSTAFHGHRVGTVAAGATAATLLAGGDAAAHAVGEDAALFSLSKMIPSAGEVDPWRVDFLTLSGLAGAGMTFAERTMHEHRSDFPASPSTGCGPARVYRMSGAVVPAQANTATVGYPYEGFANYFGDGEMEGVEFEDNDNIVPNPNYRAYCYINGLRTFAARFCKFAELVFSYGGEMLVERCLIDKCELDKMALKAKLVDTRVAQMRNAAGMKEVEVEGGEVDLAAADCERLTHRSVKARNKGHGAGRFLFHGYGANDRTLIEGGEASIDRLAVANIAEDLRFYGKSLLLDGSAVAYAGGKLVFSAGALTAGGGSHTDVATWLGAVREGVTVLEWAAPIFSGWAPDGSALIGTWVAAKSVVTAVRAVGPNVEVTLDHRGLAPQTGWRAFVAHHARVDAAHAPGVPDASAAVVPYQGDHPHAGGRRLQQSVTGPYRVLAPRGFLRTLTVTPLRRYDGPDQHAFLNVHSRGDSAWRLRLDLKDGRPRVLSTEGLSLADGDAYDEGGVEQVAITRGTWAGTAFSYPIGDPAATPLPQPGAHAPGGTAAQLALVRIEFEVDDLV